MKYSERQIGKMLFWLLTISIITRGILASWLEFGNDEVYYWTYALYPDWSHFDHPGMVGWLMQLFSLNLLFDSEFFLRLSSVIFMTANTYIVFRIGKEIKDAQTGLYASLLYTASIYAFVITGIFILPDTPQNLFWLLSFWMFVKFFKVGKVKHLLFAGLFAGACMLSKYTGVFLWVGTGSYILLFDRKQLKNPYLYLSLAISALCCLPILIWNLQNDFISFSFHSERVSLFGKPRFDCFFTELAGEFFYNNPVNFVLAIITLIAIIRGKKPVRKTDQRLILCTSLPIIAMFLFFSLTRSTLPHWNAPGFTLLILLSASFLSDKNPIHDGMFKIPKAITSALLLLALVITVGSIEIKTGFIPLANQNAAPTELGKDDFTLDLYGWRQLKPKFEALREEKIKEGLMDKDDGIIANNWFPLANIDYYVARPLGMKVLGFGKPENIHKYLWINDERGGINKGDSYWFISDSHFPKDPNVIYKWKFNKIIPAGTIDIERNGKVVKHVYVYMCKKLVYPPKDRQTLKAEKAHQKGTED
jgi:4-amino-4-deoxy-L-arabinose transferase and related glycosyltransferases of PMT family